jgi:hypothetical protein
MMNAQPQDPVVAWADLAASVPHLDSFGRTRLEKRVAYLATVRPDGSPRLHPVSPFTGAGHLYVYMEPTSPKAADLRRDARYALHCGVEDDSGGGGEFSVGGRAEEVVDEKRRSLAFGFARSAGYKPSERHVLFELKLARVLATTYGDGPRRERWSSSGR